jgi:hypothetical protein
MKRLSLLPALPAVLLLALAGPVGAQQPEAPKNLQVLPRDIPRDTLIQIMRGFALSLGVRCTYCHVAEAPATPGGQERMNFAADDKPEKQKARFMMRMVREINARVAVVPHRSNPPVGVSCVTCHRGSPLPRTIDMVVRAAVDSGGAAAGIARYRQLRQDAMESGRFDFGEQPVNELSRRLANEGKTAEAAALLEMNAEFHPNSAAIDLQLGDVYRARGENDRAIVRYRMALSKQPNNRMAAQRIQELTGEAPRP